MSSEQKLEALSMLLETLKHFHNTHPNCDKAIPESFQFVIKQLFPKGL